MELDPADVLRALPSVSYACTPAGELRHVSASVDALCGHSAAALLAGRPPFAELVAARARGAVSAARAGAALDQPMHLEYPLARADGSLTWVVDHAALRALPGEPLLVGFLVEASACELEGARERWRDRLDLLGELSAGLAHEVNNPLSGVLNYAQLAQRLPPDDPRLAEALAGIVVEGRRILEITQALLGYTPRPAGEGARPQRADELLSAALMLQRRRLRVAGVDFQLDVPPDLPPLAARGRGLLLALGACLANALAALEARFPGRDPAKRLWLRARYEPDVLGELGAVALEVEDAGHGPSDDAQRDATRLYWSEREGLACGLGLSLAREVLEAHGGDLSLVRGPEGGALVRLRVPVYAG